MQMEIVYTKKRVFNRKCELKILFFIPSVFSQPLLEHFLSALTAYAVRRVRLDAKAASPGLGVAPTSVSENPKGIFRYIARLRYPESGIPHTLRAKSIHQVLPVLSECTSKNSFYICIVIPTRKDSSPGTRSRSPPWPSMIFRTEESPIP